MAVIIVSNVYSMYVVIIVCPPNFCDFKSFFVMLFIIRFDNIPHSEKNNES
jgi:hypothetical protein